MKALRDQMGRRLLISRHNPCHSEALANLPEQLHLSPCEG